MVLAGSGPNLEKSKTAVGRVESFFRFSTKNEWRSRWGESACAIVGYNCLVFEINENISYWNAPRFYPNFSFNCTRSLVQILLEDKLCRIATKINVCDVRIPSETKRSLKSVILEVIGFQSKTALRPFKCDV